MKPWKMECDVSIEYQTVNDHRDTMKENVQVEPIIHSTSNYNQPAVTSNDNNSDNDCLPDDFSYNLGNDTTNMHKPAIVSEPNVNVNHVDIGTLNADLRKPKYIRDLVFNLDCHHLQSPTKPDDGSYTAEENSIPAINKTIQNNEGEMNVIKIKDTSKDNYSGEPIKFSSAFDKTGHKVKKNKRKSSVPIPKSKMTASRSKRKINEVCYNESVLSVSTSQSLISKQVENNKNRSISSKKSSKNSDCQVYRSLHFNEMFSEFHRLQQTGTYCDVRLNTDGGCILVHSLVIITASPYLLKLYKALPKIYTDVEPIKTLTLSDVPYWALDKIVTFLYSGETVIADTQIDEFNQHCDTLGITGLELKTIPKRIVIDSNVSETKGTKKKVKKANKVKQTNAKNKNTDCVSGGQASINSKSRKRKLGDGKCSQKKIKKTEKIKLADIENESPANIIARVQTTENQPDVLDSRENRNDDTTESCLSASCDVNGSENNVENSIEGNNVFTNSVDDTDSYLDNEITESNREKVKAKDVSVDSGVISDVNTVDNIPVCSDGGVCEKCGVKFYFAAELSAHKPRCSGKNSRQRKKCVTCDKTFDETDEYFTHRNTDKTCLALRQERLAQRKQKRFERRRQFECCVCPRRFRRTADKIDHEFTAHEIKYDKEQWPDLYCEYCEFWTMNPWKLHHHKLVSCNKGQDSICDICGNTYKNEKTLQKHKQRMHTDIEPMLTCEECGKSLKGKKGLSHHVRVKHRGENLNNKKMCHICSQTYRTNNELTFHLYKVHQQPLPEGYLLFRCHLCDYEHNGKRFFEKHLLLHDDKREWHCDICLKDFKTKNSLNTHRIIHTSQRIPCPFEDCSYKAMKNNHLKNHIANQHTQKGEKRERCHLCDYSTFFKGNLIKHQRSVHKLEVVTRHSVEMKAKYKNMKSGQIVGFEEDAHVCDISSTVPCGHREINSDSLTAGEVNSDSMTVLQREVNSDSLTVLPQHELSYPITSTPCNSMVESPHQDKPVLVATQNIVDPLTYTVSNVQLFTARPGTFPTTVYSIPPIDFTTYYTS